MGGQVRGMTGHMSPADFQLIVTGRLWEIYNRTIAGAGGREIGKAIMDAAHAITEQAKMIDSPRGAR